MVFQVSILGNWAQELKTLRMNYKKRKKYSRTYNLKEPV